MTFSRWTAGGVLALAGGLALSAAVLHAGDERAPAPAETERLLYVRSASMARRTALTFGALVADVYWMRAIQHYGRDRKSARTTSRFELLFPWLDITTSLDPDFSVAYRLGAVFLAEPGPSGPGRVDQAVALLEKGLRHDPRRWQYAFDIGFTYYWYGTEASDRSSDYARAAEWFERASALPGAPIWLRPLAAVTRAEGGDTGTARRLLTELTESDQDWVRRVAARGLSQLNAIDAMAALQQTLDRFVATHGRGPASWAELHPGSPEGAVPIDPAGVPYEYDPQSRRIVISPQSPLSPLPRTAAAR